MNTKKPLVIMRGVDLIEEQIERTKSEDWRERKQALKEICPCKVEKEIDMFWCVHMWPHFFGDFSVLHHYFAIWDTKFVIKLIFTYNSCIFDCVGSVSSKWRDRAIHLLKV
jgi:hypothetical protein